MKRLTRRDWLIINDALAAIESGEFDEQEEMFGKDYADQLQAVRRKVWERLPDLVQD